MNKLFNLLFGSAVERARARRMSAMKVFISAAEALKRSVSDLETAEKQNKEEILRLVAEQELLSEERNVAAESLKKIESLL